MYTYTTTSVINIDMDMKITDGTATINKNSTVAGAFSVMSNVEVIVAKYLPLSEHPTYMFMALPVGERRVAGTVPWSPKHRCMESKEMLNSAIGRTGDSFEGTKAKESQLLVHGHWPRGKYCRRL